MAIQNNLKAIFYGKVGQIIGQRYKDKNIVRSYKKPANPQTPLQQKNRQQFARAAKLASYAMSINFKAPCWENPSIQEYALRLKTAKNRIKNYIGGLEVLPIYPDGYTPKIQINDVRVNFNDTQNGIKFTSNQIKNLSTGRKIWFYLQLLDDEGGVFHEHTDIFTITPGNDIFYTYVPPTTQEYSEINITGVSVDDEAYNGDMLYIHAQGLVP